MYHIGQRVVCIVDPSDWYNYRHAIKYGLVFPQKNIVYTIRSVNDALVQGAEAGPYLRFVELKNPMLTEGSATGEPQFHASKFRPLDEKRIEVFRNLLVPVKNKVTS